jgi:hypothetical protein
MEAPVIGHDETIAIEEIPKNKQDRASKEVVGIEEMNCAKGKSKYHQPVWCPRGLNKTQWHKLPRARHKQPKKEMLAKEEGEGLNSKHVKIPSGG